MLSNLWKKDIFLSNINIDNYDVLSLDIFDTLLLRTVGDPDDVFIKVGEEGIKNRAIRKGLTPFDFKQIRILAQSKARKINEELYDTREITLEEIYQCMPDNIGDREKLYEIEILMEKETCYINKSVESLIEAFKKNNKKVILVSDMYLNKDQIEDTLRYNELNMNLIDDILVSSEYKVSKSNGLLFETLLDILPNGVLGDKILHIGDNKQSDYYNAKKYGLYSMHYNVTGNEREDIFKYEEMLYGSLLPEIKSLRKLAFSLTSNFSKKERVFFEVGSAVLGPILCIFADWIIEIIKAENRNKIYPLMRDGMIFSKLIPNALDENSNIQIEPLFVSRESVVTPSVVEYDREEIEKIIDRKNLCLKDVFSILSIDEESHQYKEYLECKNSTMNSIILETGRSLREDLIEFLSGDKLNKKINDSMKERRENFIGYLRNICDGDFNNILTIDIGFKGSIQRAIEKIFKTYNIDYDITHALLVGSEKNKHNLFEGIDIRGFLSNAGEHEDLVRLLINSYEVVEQLLMGDYATTVDYGKDDNRYQPVFGENLIPSDDIKYKAIFEEGVLLFQKLWLVFTKNKKHIRQDVLNKRKDLFKILIRLVDFPRSSEAEFLGDLHYDDNFGTSSVSKICNEDVKLDNDRIFEYKNHGFHYLSLRWPQGQIARNDSKYLVKKYFEKNDNNPYFVILKDIIKQMKEENIESLLIYGAGIAGQNFASILDLYDIKVEYFVDRNSTLWGEYIDEVKVISLDEAKRLGKQIFLVGSLAFIEDIKYNLECNIKDCKVFYIRKV